MEKITLEELLEAKKVLEDEIKTLIKQFESNYPVKVYNIYYLPGEIDFNTKERERKVQISLDI